MRRHCDKKLITNGNALDRVKVGFNAVRITMIRRNCQRPSGSARLTGAQPLRGFNPLRGSRPLHVLIVDDEEDIRDLLSMYFGKQGIEVFEASSEAELRELLARVRSVGRRAVVQLEPATVVTESSNPLRFHGFMLDVERRKLTDAKGNDISLTTGDFALLVALVEKPGHLLSRDDLLRRTHHRDARPFDRTIDVQIGRLRKKLGDDGKDPRIIKSVRGAGYVLVAT